MPVFSMALGGDASPGQRPEGLPPRKAPAATLDSLHDGGRVVDEKVSQSVDRLGVDVVQMVLMAKRDSGDAFAMGLAVVGFLPDGKNFCCEVMKRGLPWRVGMLTFGPALGLPGRRLAECGQVVQASALVPIRPHSSLFSPWPPLQRNHASCPNFFCPGTKEIPPGRSSIVPLDTAALDDVPRQQKGLT